MSAYRHWNDGRQWIRIIDENGNEWDEPISGWTEILNLTDGSAQYRHGATNRVCKAI